ncbi:MAG: acetyl-CoA decarbonylase/synthase complex subunit gamma [Anaerolineae bacterium]
MALSGIQIYKMLPQTNCKECGFPTCLAFAMKLAAKQVELSACPYVSEASKAQLAESAAPPMRLITLKSDGHELKVGNEVVLFRHEKTFYNRPGLFIKVRDDEDVAAKVTPADQFAVSYVGMDLTIDGFAIEATGDAAKFAAAVKAVRAISKRPIVLISPDAKIIAAGLDVIKGENALISGANATNWEAMAEVAKANKAALVVTADSIEAVADLTEKIKGKGVEDLVIDPAMKNLSKLLTISTQLRRLALKKNVRSVGYPLYVAANDSVLATQAIAKYAGFVVLDDFKAETVYPLLVLRQNIYTDPQKPIQVQPGLYEINNPKPESPVLVTTNFSITYFSVANEVESSGLPAWLLVTDAEGMSVLTAWAAGKFDAERIAKAVKGFNVADKIAKKRVVLPGHVAVLSGELEAELPGWEIKVGPREAVDLPAYMKQVL